MDSSGEDRKGIRRNEVGREGLAGCCQEGIGGGERGQGVELTREELFAKERGQRLGFSSQRQEV